MQETVCIILNITPEIYIHENTDQNVTFVLLLWGTQRTPRDSIKLTMYSDTSANE